MDMNRASSLTSFIIDATSKATNSALDDDDDVPLSQVFKIKGQYEQTTNNSHKASSKRKAQTTRTRTSKPKIGPKRSETLFCGECDDRFHSKTAVARHMKDKHFSERKCSICDEVLLSKAAFSVHMQLHDPEDRVICKDCCSEFKTLKSYQKHAKMYPDPHNFKCLRCLRQFKSEARFEGHMCICTNGQPLLCACGNTFTTYPDVVAHARGSNPFYCCTCKHQAKTLTGYIRHVRSHSNQKPYPCKLCSASFTSAEILKSHVKNVHKNFDDKISEENNTCVVCSEQFSSPEDLHKHQESHQWRVPCPDCDKTFLPHRLELHREKHKLSSSLCPKCGKLCDSPLRLTQHLQSAHNNDPVTCDICNKVLKTKKILTEHLKTHLKTDIGKRVAQAICPVCGMELAQKGSLTRHIILVHERHRLVQDATPRLCKDCGITLPNKAKYYSHRRQHRAMIDKFPCSICQREFNKKQNLVRHMYLLHDSRRILEDPTFRCQLCTRSFRERKNLLRHYRLVHKVEDFESERLLQML